MYRDYIIIGGGLAGMSLAFRLLQRGKSVMLFNWREHKAASRVAAGLMNPLVFKRLTLGWRSNEFLNEADRFYTELERILGAHFYIKAPFYRIHGSEFERNHWSEMTDNTELKAYLGSSVNDEITSAFTAAYGCSILHGTSAVLSGVFLDAAKNYLLEQDSMRNEKIELNDLQSSPEGVNYKDISASKVVLCTGAHAANEGPFSYLPFKIAKGEVLTIRCVLPNIVFNGKVYGVPVSPGVFKVGSTYAWDQVNDDPTREGMEEITGNLNSILQVDYEILQHEAGFRPTVKDRRPLLGLSQHNPNLAIFNGLGTKGYLMAPLLSLEMCEFLCDNKPLHPELNISRF